MASVYPVSSPEAASYQFTSTAFTQGGFQPTENNNSADDIAGQARTLIQTHSPGVKDEVVDELVKGLTATPGSTQFVAAVLADHQTVMQAAAAVPAGDWTKQCPAGTTVGTTAFFMTAELALEAPLNVAGSGKNRGFYQPGFQTTQGTYYYNDATLQSGEVTFAIECSTGACSIKVSKNFQVIGEYHGQGSGTIVGSGGGLANLVVLN